MKATIFFPTRNRPNMVKRLLDNIVEFCPNHVTLIGNCSSKDRIKETSDVVECYKDKINIQEIVFNPDPGCAKSYSDLFFSVKTELAIVWADDMLFLKNHEYLFDNFMNFSIQLIGLPMIDDVSASPLTRTEWPKDKHGCALWETTTGRCAHHSIVRTSYFQKYSTVYTSSEYIDNFFHNHTLPMMRIWPDDGAYILHTRIDDDTRYGMKIEEGIFRYSEERRKEFFGK